MTFTRVRTIKGRRYYYEETRYRDGPKVKSISKYLGPVIDGVSAVVVEHFLRTIGDQIRVREPGSKIMDEWDARHLDWAKARETKTEEPKAEEAITSPAVAPLEKETPTAVAKGVEAATPSSSETGQPSASDGSEAEASPQ